MSNQCDHGHLRRVCEVCQRDEEIEQLKAERDALQLRLKLAEAVASAASAWNVADKAEGNDWAEREALETALKPWRVQRDIDAAMGKT